LRKSSACSIRHKLFSAKYLPVLPPRRNWLCFADLTRVPGTSPHAASSRIGFVLHEYSPQGHGEPAPRRRGARRMRPKHICPYRWRGFGLWIHTHLHVFACVFESSIMNHQLPGPSRTRASLPITRRVAGICAEKWIAPLSEIAISPCPEANKENLCADPFQAPGCCTNRNVGGISEGMGIATADCDGEDRFVQRGRGSGTRPLYRGGSMAILIPMVDTCELDNRSWGTSDRDAHRQLFTSASQLPPRQYGLRLSSVLGSKRPFWGSMP
jgi:hypothetical protein